MPKKAPPTSPGQRLLVNKLRFWPPAPYRLILFSAIIIGVILRLIFLGQQRSLWWDEGYYFTTSQLPLKDLITGNYMLYRTHPWLYLAILKLLSNASYHETWLRLSSFVPSILVIPTIFILTSKILKNKLVASIASLGYAASTYHIYLGSFIKETELNLFFNLLALFFFFDIIERRKVFSLIPFGLLLWLSALTSYYSGWLFLLIAVFTVLILISDKKDFVKSAVLIGFGSGAACVAYLPWLIILFRGIGTTLVLLGSVPRPVSVDFFDTYARYLSSPPMVGVSLVPLEVGFILAGAAYLVIKKSPSHRTAAFLLLWLFLPVATAYLFSHYYYRSIFCDWYLLFCSIPLYIILGLPFINRGNLGLKWLLIAFFVSANLYTYWQLLHRPLENWRAAVNYMETTQGLGDKDLVFTEDTSLIQYYTDYRQKFFRNPELRLISYIDEQKENMPGLFRQIGEDLKHHRKSCLISIFAVADDIPATLANRLIQPAFLDNPRVFCFQSPGVFQ